MVTLAPDVAAAFPDAKSVNEALRILLKAARNAVPMLGEHSGCREPSEAIVAYLRNRGKPATENEIIDGVFDGGYMGGDKEQYRLSIDLALRNRLTGTGRGHSVFGLKGNIIGRIGLKDWSDALF